MNGQDTLPKHLSQPGPKQPPAQLPTLGVEQHNTELFQQDEVGGKSVPTNGINLGSDEKWSDDTLPSSSL